MGCMRRGVLHEHVDVADAASVHGDDVWNQVVLVRLGGVRLLLDEEFHAHRVVAHEAQAVQDGTTLHMHVAPRVVPLRKRGFHVCAPLHELPGNVEETRVHGEPQWCPPGALPVLVRREAHLLHPVVEGWLCEGARVAAPQLLGLDRERHAAPQHVPFLAGVLGAEVQRTEQRIPDRVPVRLHGQVASARLPPEPIARHLDVHEGCRLCDDAELRVLGQGIEGPLAAAPAAPLPRAAIDDNALLHMQGLRHQHDEEGAPLHVVGDGAAGPGHLLLVALRAALDVHPIEALLGDVLQFVLKTGRACAEEQFRQPVHIDSQLRLFHLLQHPLPQVVLDAVRVRVGG
mmetsp:Transcript_5772/g.16195  ORF Transcript_5772/g.16195 Transcript_5772/m.16195 type:complete len:344 (-) Transcript_5772:304-1335(-)